MEIGKELEVCHAPPCQQWANFSECALISERHLWSHPGATKLLAENLASEIKLWNQMLAWQSPSLLFQFADTVESFIKWLEDNSATFCECLVNINFLLC